MKNIFLLLALILLASCSKDDGVEIKADMASQVEGTYNGQFDIWGSGILDEYKVTLVRVSENSVNLSCDHYPSLLISLTGDIETGLLGNSDSIIANFSYVVQKEKLEFFTGDEVYTGTKE